MAAAVSLASFFLIIFLTTPQGGAFIIALFFLTFFLSLTSAAALAGMLLDYLAHRRARPVIGVSYNEAGSAPEASSANDERTMRRSNSFRRGILLGGFGTLLLLLQSWEMLTLGMALAAFIPFALIETYTIGNSL